MRIKNVAFHEEKQVKLESNREILISFQALRDFL